jgi:hypothetical protein
VEQQGYISILGAVDWVRAKPQAAVLSFDLGILTPDEN